MNWLHGGLDEEKSSFCVAAQERFIKVTRLALLYLLALYLPRPSILVARSMLLALIMGLIQLVLVIGALFESHRASGRRLWSCYWCKDVKGKMKFVSTTHAPTSNGLSALARKPKALARAGVFLLAPKNSLELK